MVPKFKLIFWGCVAFILVIVPAFSFGGTVISVLGKVEIQTANGWESLVAGDTVQSGAVISTGFRSQTVLEVGESTITVQALSRLTLEQLTEQTDGHDSEIYLDVGSIQADVQAVANKRVGFVVKTPIATAAVRGTVLTVGPDSVSASQGTVAVSSSSGTFGGNVSPKEILVFAGGSVGTGTSTLRPPQQTYLEVAIGLDHTMTRPSDNEGSSNSLGSPAAVSANAASGGIDTVTISFE